MPYSLFKSATKEDILRILKARWNEHLVEDVLLAVGHGQSLISDSQPFQKLLVQHKLARAQLEVWVYSRAMTDSELEVSGNLIDICVYEWLT